MTDYQIDRILELAFGNSGLLLNMDKSSSDIIYNANLIIGRKKRWFGDFRKTHKHKLQLLADIVQDDVYLLREMDCRFEAETNPRLENAVFHLTPLT